MLNWILSESNGLPFELASLIACLNEPGPLSLVLVTQNVAGMAWAGSVNAEHSTRAASIDCVLVMCAVRLYVLEADRAPASKRALRNDQHLREVFIPIGRGGESPANTVSAPEKMRYTYWMHFAEGTAMPPLVMKLVFNRIE